MFKYLILFLVIYIAYVFVKASKRRADRPDIRRGSRRGEDMVSCKVCGIHLPRSESIVSRGSDYYCSKEHLQKGA
jgi:uncharacterized protein